MNYKYLLTLMIVSAFFITACENEVPLKELTGARQSIEKARSVKADHYSPDEFKAAETELTKAHSQLIKDEEPEDSAKSAVESSKKAMEAYDKAVVLYAQDTLKNADDAINEAEAVYAEKLSPENFNESRELYLAANEKNEGKMYPETIKLAEEAYLKAVKAREESLDNKYQLQVKIDNVNSTLAKIEKYNYEKYAQEKYNLASENVKKAEAAYNTEALKSGFESAEIAGISADEAYKDVMEGYTDAKISEAEKVVADAEKSKGAKAGEVDLAASKEALENSKRLKSEGNYDESVTYANEAIRHGNSVIEEGSKTVVANVKADGESGKYGKNEDAGYYYYRVKTWEKYQDCLWRISKKYYKNPRLWKKIYRANKSKINNPNIIRPGWVIRIPKLNK